MPAANTPKRQRLHHGQGRLYRGPNTNDSNSHILVHQTIIASKRAPVAWLALPIAIPAHPVPSRRARTMGIQPTFCQSLLRLFLLIRNPKKRPPRLPQTERPRDEGPTRLRRQFCQHSTGFSISANMLGADKIAI